MCNFVVFYRKKAYSLSGSIGVEKNIFSVLLCCHEREYITYNKPKWHRPEKHTSILVTSISSDNTKVCVFEKKIINIKARRLFVFVIG